MYSEAVSKYMNVPQMIKRDIIVIKAAFFMPINVETDHILSCHQTICCVLC